MEYTLYWNPTYKSITIHSLEEQSVLIYKENVAPTTDDVETLFRQLI